MIVVAIIGILAAIAYPAYTEQVSRGRRSDAATVLMEASQVMQRYYNANNSFGDNADATAALTAAGVLRVPKGAAVGDQTYDITVDVAANARSYTLTAAPTITDSKCGSLTLSQTGAKGVTATDGEVADCWK